MINFSCHIAISHASCTAYKKLKDLKSVTLFINTSLFKLLQDIL